MVNRDLRSERLRLQGTTLLDFSQRAEQPAASRQRFATNSGRRSRVLPPVLTHWPDGGVGMNIDQDTIRQLAEAIWETEGKPEGQQERHWEMATKLAESAAMAPVRNGNKRHRLDALFPEPDNDPDAE
jgi:LmbE family N-acetylglucosaminyl deacetylase